MMTLLEFAPLIIMTLIACFAGLVIFSSEETRIKTRKHRKKAIKHA